MNLPLSLVSQVGTVLASDLDFSFITVYLVTSAS